jgi:hypothetical protein
VGFSFTLAVPCVCAICDKLEGKTPIRVRLWSANDSAISPTRLKHDLKLGKISACMARCRELSD